jgi:hypothetical protein
MDKILSKGTIDKLRSLQNVVGIGKGLKQKQGMPTGEEAIVILVRKKVPLNELPEDQVIPSSIEGKLSDVIEVGEISIHGGYPGEGNVVEAYSPVEDLIARQSRWRPAPGGVSIGHYKITAGTLGSVVYDYRGRKLILSNNHVLANATTGRDDRARIGDAILQPGAYDGGTIQQDRIAVLYRYVPLKDNDYNIVDAAVAAPLTPNLVVPFILGVGSVYGTISPKFAMLVKKSGRTTGVTHGIIIATNAIVDVDYGNGRTLSFKDQIITTNISAGGDSGSIVLSESDWAVGLLFAGSLLITVVNPIEAVLNSLCIRF